MPAPRYAQVLAERDRRRAQPVPQAVVEAGRGRLLDELLVAPLHRAVPVAQVDDPLPVAEQLHLDVPPALDVPLQVHPRVAERRLRLRARHRHRVLQLSRVAHHPQPAPPAAPRRLDQHRKPDPAGRQRPPRRSLAAAARPAARSRLPGRRDRRAGRADRRRSRARGRPACPRRPQASPGSAR